MPLIGAWPDWLEQDYQAWLAGRSAAGTKHNCSTMVALYACSILHTVLTAGGVGDAISTAVQTVAFHVGPPWAAQHRPEQLGKAWTAAHSLRSLLLMASALGWFPCVTVCAALRRGGPWPITLIEIAFQPLQQVRSLWRIFFSVETD